MLLPPWPVWPHGQRRMGLRWRGHRIVGLVLGAVWIGSVASTNHFQHYAHEEKGLGCCRAGI